MISPESFIDVVPTISVEEIVSLNQKHVFTIRQLASAFDKEISFLSKERFSFLKEQALSIIGAHQEEAVTETVQPAGDVWGYCYVTKATYDMIVFKNVYKSPYALFEEVMSSGSNDAWKSVCGEVLEEHKFTTPPTDSDIYSFLIWRCANTLTKVDYSIGARAIPFVWEWMPGMMHGTSMQLARIYSESKHNPAIADRYDYQIGINLSEIKRQGGEIYSANEPGSKGRDKYKWQPINLNKVGVLQKDLSLWGNFTAGDNYRDHVPHGIVVPHDGIIPGDCLFLFPQAKTEVVEIRY